MNRTLSVLTISIIISGISLRAHEQPKQEPKFADMPGITTADKTPNACVNCHANHPESKMDHRLTSLLLKWRNGSDPHIVKLAQATVPANVKLQGKHPDITGKVKTIPNDCMKCHTHDSELAPPFNRLPHLIHLTGGKENHFLAGGNSCTNCHKLDQKNGVIGVGSGVEK